MALPVVPTGTAQIALYGNLREATSCDDNTNISLKGLITGVRGDGSNMNFTPVAATNLGLGGGTVNCDHLTTWLPATNGGDDFPLDGPGAPFEVSDFPRGRAADSTGYVGQ